MRTPIRRRTTERVTPQRVALELRRSARSAAVVALGAVIAVLAISTVLGKIHVRWPWQATETYQVTLASVAGVQPKQNEVRIAGLRVGTITKIERRGDRAVATLEIDPEHGPIYRDATIKLRAQTPLQDMYLDVTSRGTRGAGELPATTPLPVEQSAGNVDVASVLDAFNGDTRANMTRLIDQLSVGLDDNGQELRAAFVELVPFLQAADRLVGQLASRRRSTASLVHNLRELTVELGDRDRQLASLIRDGSTTVQAIGAREAALGRTLDGLPPTLAQMQSTFGTVRGTLDELDPALRALRPTATALRRGLRDLQRIGRAADPTLIALRPPIRALRPLADAVPPAAGAISRAAVTITPQATRLDRITRRIVPCELGVQKFFTHTASAFKFSDAKGVIPRGAAVLGTELLGGTIKSPNLAIRSSCTDGK